MDFQLMQWRNQHQSDHQQKQQVESEDRKHDQQHQHQSLSALPLFLTEPVSSKVGNMSVQPDMPSTSKFPKMMMMGGQQQFSSAQWQELELQAVIFRYMLAGASVPAELLQPIKNSLLNSSSFFLHHPLQHFPLYHQPATSSAALQSGYWGRAGMDPEPGRCRRTDGKKWRCSRDVAPGHKYCERHMNRGRNRSRKPVELPRPRNIMTPTNAIGGEELRKTATSPMMLGAVSRGQFGSFEGAASPSSDILHFNNNSRSPFEQNHGDGGCSDGKVLRRFFDDWPRSMAEQGSGGMNADPTSLSMSFRSSDVSLKLSTGSGSGNEDQTAEKDHWMSQWGQHQAGPMGGPLAEALRSSAHP